MMIRRLTIAMLMACPLFALLPDRNLAAAEQFPYQAVVVADQTEVRCGPGMKFYATSIAKKNDQVTVHRHDHGGWYMISPPPGSFSWIDASLVNPIGGNRGVVTITPGAGAGSRAIVRIGSVLSDDHSFFGRELSNGDEVVILGEKVLAGPSGGKRMLKIAPPAQEFRWIKGEFLVPMSRQIQQQLAQDPYQIPAEFRQRMATVLPLDAPSEESVEEAPRMAKGDQRSSDSEAERKSAGLVAPEAEFAPPIQGNDSELPRTTSVPRSRQQQEFARLDEIDARYQQIIKKDPSEWDLDDVCRSYEELKRTAGPHVAQLAADRLEQASRRRDIAQHYRNFIQISEETSQRDAQLLAQKPDVLMGRLEAPPEFTSVMDNSAPQMSAAEPVIQQMSGVMPAAPEGVTPQLNGAGILHRVQAPPGFPPYILVAPNGRMLAYVDPAPGVSVEEWIGKPAGIIGRRSREDGYNMDVIRAQRVVPVRLSP
jgi:hypothetical protein